MLNRPLSNNACDRSPAFPAIWPERFPEKCRRPGPWLCACAEPRRRRSQCPPTPGHDVAERAGQGKRVSPPPGANKLLRPRIRHETCRKSFLALSPQLSAFSGHNLELCEDGSLTRPAEQSSAACLCALCGTSPRILRLEAFQPTN